MKAIEWFWNLMFYCMYKWNVRMNRAFEYINPFYWLNKTASFKERKAKQGISDWNNFTDNLMNNPKSGLGLSEVYYAIGGLFVVIEFDILFTGLFLLGISSDYIFGSSIALWISGLVIFVIATIFDHFVLYRNDKYLNYFAIFEKLSDRKKKVYSWLCFGVIILICMLFFVTLSLQ